MRPLSPVAVKRFLDKICSSVSTNARSRVTSTCADVTPAPTIVRYCALLCKKKPPNKHRITAGNDTIRSVHFFFPSIRTVLTLYRRFMYRRPIYRYIPNLIKPYRHMVWTSTFPSPAFSSYDKPDLEDPRLEGVLSLC